MNEKFRGEYAAYLDADGLASAHGGTATLPPTLASSGLVVDGALPPAR